MNADEINALLQDCLSQFEALNNSCRFTHSQELRDRLKLALGLPVEPALCEECGCLPGVCACGTYSEPTYANEVI